MKAELLLLAGVTAIACAVDASGPPFVRQRDKIVDAPEADQKVAHSYGEFKNKGEIINGYRVTIMTAKTEYEVGEEVRVIHVLEATGPGLKVMVMGPKTVDEEYVDGKLAAQQGPDQGVYDGRVLDSPAVDLNYEITCYRFAEPGVHTIQWRGGRFGVAHRVGMTGNMGLKSNTLTIHVRAKAQPNGATNGSQPIRLETNRTSSVAGSRQVVGRGGR